MESYEEFCQKTLALLQQEGQRTKKSCEPLWTLQAHSVIHFHGRAVLSPLLSAEQRREMCEHRRRSAQLELNKQNQQRNNIMARVQDILEQAQAHKAPNEDGDRLKVSKSVPVSGYTLVTDSPEPAKDPACEPQTNTPPAPAASDSPVLNGDTSAAEEKVDSEEKSDQEEEDDISLDSLLQRSREYMKREQSQQESRVVRTVIRTPPPQTVMENKGCSPTGDTGVEFGFSLRHSPVGLPQNLLQHQSLYDSGQQQQLLFPSQPDCYADLPRPELSVSPRPQRRKPRPVSAGNIPFTFPISPADLIPRHPGKLGEGDGAADSLSGAMKPSDSYGSGGYEEDGGGDQSGSRRSSHCGTSPVQEARSPASASRSSPKGQHDHLTAGFRRRCHTLDSHPHNHHAGAEHIDRSQERVPRLMAGVTWMPPSRRTAAAPLNQSYSVVNSSPFLLRHRITPDPMGQVTVGVEPEDPPGINNGRVTPTVLRNAAETQNSKTEENLRCTHTLEDMQRRLEEEHALQMSLLLAQQEREQQRLCLEFRDTERGLKEQGCVRRSSGETCRWTCRPLSDSCSVISSSCPGLSPARTPSDRSPGNGKGFPSPVNSRVSSPSVQPAAYLWGPCRVVNKPQARLSLVLNADQQRAFCRVGAIIRGFLTRRLLKTEKVKHLRQTIVDTQEFICSFQSETPLNRVDYTAQDFSLQERVRAQLRAALYNIHDIFFEMPLEDRLALLQHDRELRAERKLREIEKTKGAKEKVILSAATQRSLDRKKRVGESQGQARKTQQKPKSPTTNRVLKSNQAQNSPTPGQLNRQGSWYRRTPEERVRHLDSLKKQHSLG